MNRLTVGLGLLCAVLVTGCVSPGATFEECMAETHGTGLCLHKPHVSRQAPQKPAYLVQAEQEMAAFVALRQKWIDEKAAMLRSMEASIPLASDQQLARQEFQQAVSRHQEFVRMLDEQVDNKRQELNARIASIEQQNRANAMAVLPFLMQPPPVYQPYMIPPLQLQPPRQPLNCTSSKIGNQVFTNCY